MTHSQFTISAPIEQQNRYFCYWQPKYAQHGIATFPVTITPNNDKVPRTRGYLQTGLQGSAQLALKFADAELFGFACGKRNRITIVDLDDTDPTIVEEGERIFGQSPLLWRTGGGKYAMPFRHNGESRRIRPIPSLPIDLLGGGFVVTPPSMGASRRYEIIRGSLADLDNLPTARIPDEIARAISPKSSAGKIQEGERNVSLFNYCCGVVAYSDDLDQLIGAAETWADQQLALPLSSAEIVRTCNSVWQFRGGRKRVMNVIVGSDEYKALSSDPATFGVFAFLSAENGPSSTFMIADALGVAKRWPRRLVPAARKKMLELRVVDCVRKPRKGVPGLYRWRMPT